MNKLDECKRAGFKNCFCAANGYGIFKGRIINEKNDKFFFGKVYIQYTDYHKETLCICKDKEYNIWVNAADFRNNGVSLGDCVEFFGRVCIYQKKDNTHELVIKNPKVMRKLERYELLSETA